MKNVFEKRYESLGGDAKVVTILPSVRINTLSSSEHAATEQLKAKGVVLEKIPFAKHGYWIKESAFSLGASIEYLRGLMTPQEAAAQLPVQVLDPQPGDSVLDIAAAPGVKTAQIAQWMQNKGAILAIEKNNRRIPALKNNLERMGVTQCIIVNTDGVKVQEWAHQFDKALVDAPCMGNYLQDPDWIGRHSPTETERNSQTQKTLLASAVKVVKSGGTIVYSTCSLEPEEDEMIIDWALRTLHVRVVETGLTIGVPGVTNAFGKRLNADVAKTRRLWPSQTGTEGFFIAKLVKK